MIGTSRKEILGRGSTPREALDDWYKQFVPYWDDALPTTAQLTWMVAPEINCIGEFARTE